MNKLRARDDLRRNLVNLRTSVIAPITLPTRDHIAQLSKDAFRANTKWAFLKADHDSSYKQPPLDPDFAGITVVTLRGPTTSIWHALFPRALLFGAVYAVIHYNCLARALAVLINRTLGIPILNYFDDFGALVPDPLGTMALWMVENTSLALGAPMETIKSLVRNQLTFLRLLGSFPDPQRGLILRVEPPPGKDHEMATDPPRSHRRRPDRIQTLRKANRQAIFHPDLSIRPFRPYATNPSTRQTQGETILRDPPPQRSRHSPLAWPCHHVTRRPHCINQT